MASLDTNVLIDLGNPRRAGHVRASYLLGDLLRRGEAICTTRLNVAELRAGIEQAADRVSEEARVRRALTSVTILELDEPAAEHFGRLRAHLYRLGRPVGDMDTLIAAVCLASGQTLVTRNPRHFADVPGLRVESY
jgi:tRNA(fMet)-specific endonuclease VapC